MFKKNFKSSVSDMQENHTSFKTDADPIPQSLKEVLKLMDSINRNLEDCAVEWQSKVSKEQWKMVNTEYGTEKSSNVSLLARTYFTDETLDEAFRKLLAYVRTFMDYLNTFIALLQGERSIIIPGSKKDVEIQMSNPTISYVNETAKNTVAPLDLSLLDNDNNNKNSPHLSEKLRRSKRVAENSGSDVQQCFADLIKAKIDLDTKFLGFEAVLNGGSNKTVLPAEDVCCLCQICSNVLGTVIDNQKILNDAVTKPKIRRATAKSSPKKLSRSTKLWKRNENRKQSVSLVNIADKSISPEDLENV